jgi:hypothetical protein
MRVPRREDFHQTLRQRNALRLHGWLIGGFMMLFTWAVSHFQWMLWGDGSLALRYLVTLGAGYLVYLLVLHEWSRWVLLREDRGDADVDAADLLDVADIAMPRGHGGSGAGSAQSGGGGDFTGGGASGSFDGGGGSDILGDVASSALEVAGGADEGAIVVVPVVAIFVVAVGVVLGAGTLVWLYFGSEVLLAVAVELAFSVATARALMGAERAGWFTAAVRLTWKPLLGALLCAVALGWALDHWLPQAQSLPHAVQMMRSR